MGQQQLILILLAIMVVGVAIAAGLGLFSSNAAEQNKLAIINDLNNLRVMAYKFRIRPATMAGGAGTYVGFAMPSKFMSNENAAYSMAIEANEITIVATSYANPTNKITTIIDSKGKISTWTYSGDFQ
jgi:hypothetical protein